MLELNQIKGIGAKSVLKLRESGIENLTDLVFYFPHKYIDATNINNFTNSEEATAYGKLIKIEKKHFKKGLSYVKAEFITSNNQSFTATFFNQPFIFTALKKESLYYINGKAKINHGKIEISSPKIITISRLKPIIPIYKSTGINAGIFQDAISFALENTKLNGFLNEEIRGKYGLIDFNTALKNIHFPLNKEEMLRAKRSISVETLALYIKQFYTVKKKDKKEKQFTYEKKLNLPDIIKRLEFELNSSQIKALNEIVELMDSRESMNALLEGDVGSGKTIVAFLAIYYALINEHQSVFMSPTEILANQHYKKAVDFFGKEKVALLTGATKDDEKEIIKNKIKSKEIKVIIGTHSLFSKDIIYNDLCLVIIDEQHRFGVNQRSALENKGVNPDCLNLSATPIPRSLALTLYGDLNLISIKEKPSKKAKVFTRFVGEKIEKMYEYVLSKAKNNEQTFIVCPRILSDEDDEVIGAKNLFDKLKKGALKDYLTLLHGKQSEEEKNKVMQSFITGEKKVLVTTSIIEVGIDIKNATTIIIHNAERFGLSQLHQLRGRVGRGSIDGFCFLLTNENSFDRLNFLESCDDGFILSEKDFELRGAGDFLGFRQHGKSLTLSKEPITAEILILAKQIAQEMEQITQIPQEDLKYFNDITLN